MVLVFFGSTNEGQASWFSSFFTDYIEDRAVVASVSRHVSQSQMADINSLFAANSVDGVSNSPSPSMEASTMNGSAIIALTPPDEDYISKITGSRAGVLQYTVQAGDLLSFIASDYGVSQESIIWANNLGDADNLKLGQILRIPPISGVIHKAKSGDTAASLAKKYKADVERIIAYNHLPATGKIDAGDELVIPEGVMPQSSIPAAVAAKGTPNAPLYGTASLAAMAKAAKLFDHLPNLGDFFKLPSFGFNWGRIHGRNGVDVANSCGTPIYAAADGTITVADGVGYNGGFGKYIKMSHPNGTETLYAHASKLLVESGQVVGKGDKIALMGTTGRSTGCHLHFEVHGAQNPLAKN